MYSVLYKKNKHTKFHGNRYNSFRDTAITNSRPSPRKICSWGPCITIGTRHQAPYAVILHALSKCFNNIKIALRRAKKVNFFIVIFEIFRSKGKCFWNDIKFYSNAIKTQKQLKNFRENANLDSNGNSDHKLNLF